MLIMCQAGTHKSDHSVIAVVRMGLEYSIKKSTELTRLTAADGIDKRMQHR